MENKEDAFDKIIEAQKALEEVWNPFVQKIYAQANPQGAQPGSNPFGDIFGGANRKLSDEDGLFIFLTPQAHNMSNNGIHFDREFDLYAKKKAQKTWMEYYGKTKEDFIRRYGKNYLDIL